MSFILRRLAVLASLVLSLAPAWAAVDVNQADQAGLESVRGIGPALSGKLLAERGKSPFKDWADLIGRVGGVGPGSAAKLSQAGLTVNGKAYAGASAAPAGKAPGEARSPAAPAAPAAKPAPARPAAGPSAGTAANPATSGATR